MKELFCVAGSTRQMRNVASALAAISIDHNPESESFDHSLKWYKTTKRMWCHNHCTFPLILLANTLYERPIFKKDVLIKKTLEGDVERTLKEFAYIYTYIIHLIVDICCCMIKLSSKRLLICNQYWWTSKGFE